MHIPHKKKKLTSYITIIHIFQKQKEEVAAEVIGGIDRTMKNRSNSTRSKKKTRIEQYQRELKQAGHCSGVHVNPKPTPQKQPITELGWGDL